MKNRIILSLLLITFFTFAFTQANSQQGTSETKPIKTIMQLLMMDMQTIEVGIWNENYQTIETGAENIVNHPKIPVAQRKEIKSILGKKMKAFVALDRQVHNHADSLARDAQTKNMDEILKHYRIIQQGCVSCHANFRTQIIEGR